MRLEESESWWGCWAKTATVIFSLSINPDTKGKKSSSADRKEEVEDVSVVHKHTQSERRDRRQTVLALRHNSTSFSIFQNSHITTVM